ncbi:GGDEF domain-containing protein [Pseudobutyrivibrio sp.]|uniref:GGDEF domain-containing protein n=1 Tax=Pseudobutyrivibrio sp. TaxID=2014367 RepID=UPI0025EE9A3E|nr:GGDEF domain-containing protein [Pseudobutyrivibrio sp.]MBR5649032.1 GGDEF domain-containing protein [Pseudobutyrivibrio sp.]
MAKDAKRHGYCDKLNKALIGICLAALILCYIFTISQYKSDTFTEIVEPYTVVNLEDGGKEYLFDLRKLDYRYSGFMFYTSHHRVEVYNSGKLIYSFTQTGGIWSSSTGSAYHFVDINEKMTNIAVVVTPIYDVVAGYVPEFYVGSSYNMYNDIMVKSMPRFVASMLILVISISLIVYYHFMKKKMVIGEELIYLGYFALFIGLWTFMETDVITLIFRNKIVEVVAPYLCLMFVIPPFVLFFHSYLKFKNEWVKNTIITLSSLELIVLSFLHFSKIAEYRETLPFIHLMMLLATVYVVAGVVIKMINKNYTRRVRVCVVGLTLFAFGVIFDIVSYYKRIGDSDQLGRYLFLVFLVLLAWDLLKGTYEVIEKGRRAKQLELFALTDSMTGLLNRNAFETYANANDDLEDLVAIVADANGLKACNDTHGHDVGDEYITVVADIFSSTFGKYGDCYRTGGDEFCCIIPSGKDINLERLKKLFLAKVYTENAEGDYKFDIGVAIGFASYAPNIDSNLRSVVKRADSAMYANKRASKKASS